MTPWRTIMFAEGNTLDFELYSYEAGTGFQSLIRVANLLFFGQDILQFFSQSALAFRKKVLTPFKRDIAASDLLLILLEVGMGRLNKSY